MPEAAITNNDAAQRFELTIDGATAELTYHMHGDSISFLHTGVPDELRNRGIAGRLASAGLKFARENHLSVVPMCPFVAEYIRRHPEEQDLVRADYRNGG